VGTNYYLRQPACPHCKLVPSELHIGKASAGWNFGLRIYPKVDGEPDERLKPWSIDAIGELEDWRSLFDRFEIYNEYDQIITPADMLATIAERSHPRGLLSRTTEHWAQHVFAGKGTYDLCHYEFS
jgi:hypothetical protein